MNAVLSHLNDSFCAKKLSLNTDKTKYFLFHKAIIKDSFSLDFPDLFINDVKIKRKNSLRFLELTIDEKLIWKTHVDINENKTEILFQESHSLNSKSL